MYTPYVGTYMNAHTQAISDNINEVGVAQQVCFLFLCSSNRVCIYSISPRKQTIYSQLVEDI